MANITITLRETRPIPWNDFISAIAERDQGPGEGLDAEQFARATKCICQEFVALGKQNPLGVLKFLLDHGG